MPSILHSSISFPHLKDSESVKKPMVFNASILQNEKKIPMEFVWADDEKLCSQPPPTLHMPPIDLKGFLSGDPLAVSNAASLIKSACEKHGFFQVVNHGVDMKLISDVHKNILMFFGMPLSEKLRAERKFGEYCGYASSYPNRFSSNLPWKETLTLHYSDDQQHSNIVQDYFLKIFGEDSRCFGRVCQEYSDAMSNLSLQIMELLGVSLGVGPSFFRDFYKGNDSSIIKLNYYPPCQQPNLTLGTGPHTDPTSLTILHQDNVGGLEVFVDEKWYSIAPCPEAFVVNIGDTFMALSNGMYKSCLHRAVVNSQAPRKSIAFFLSPKMDKVISPPEMLINEAKQRVYPEFTWSRFLEFTQKHYIVNMNTLDSFSKWLQAEEKRLQ